MTTSSPTVDDAFDRNLCASRKTEVEILMANALEEDLLRVSSEKASGISVILHSEFGTDAIMVKEDERITESALGERVKGLSLFLGDEKLNLALTFEEQMVQDGAHLFAKHANVYRYTFDHDPSRTEYVTVSMDGTSAEFRQWPGDGFVQISSVILGEDKIPVRSGLYSFEVTVEFGGKGSLDGTGNADLPVSVGVASSDIDITQSIHKVFEKGRAGWVYNSYCGYIFHSGTKHCYVEMY